MCRTYYYVLKCRFESEYAGCKVWRCEALDRRDEYSKTNNAVK